MINKIRRLFDTPPKNPHVDNAPKPQPKVSTTRITSDTGDVLAEAFDQLVNELSYMQAFYPFNLSDVIDNLFLFDPNFGKLLHTTVSLGNSGHELIIEAPTARQADLALREANDLSARCFPNGGGADGLVNVLLSQATRTGGMVAEWVPDKNKTQIQRVYPFPVWTIRFKKDQKGNLVLGQLQDQQFVILNPLQVSYHAIRLQDGNPYPIPPVLNALRSAVVNKKVRDSINDWFSRLPILGVANITYDVPAQLPGESQDDYDVRCQRMLNELASSAGDNLLTKGVMVGFDNMKMTFNNTTAAAQGASELLQAIEEDLFTGLKADPVLFGRSFSRTETWSKVAFEELVNSLKSTQQGVKRVLEHGHRLNLALKGLSNLSVKLRFKPMRSLDAIRDANAESLLAGSILNQYNSGLISRDEARKELGYDKIGANADAYIASFERDTGRYELIHSPHRTVWPGTELQINHTVDDTDKKKDNYLEQVRQLIAQANQEGLRELLRWAKDHKDPDVERYIQNALDTFVAAAEGSMKTAVIAGLATGAVTTFYEQGRRGKGLFPAYDKRTFGIDVVFDAEDRDAINYLSKVDTLFISKYLSHSKTRQKQITGYLRSAYLEGGQGIGDDPDGFSKFKAEFPELVEQIGEHASRVIVDANVQRSRNWGQVITLDKERITEYRFVAAADSRTCSHCHALNGRLFKVERDVQRIRQLIASGEEDISQAGKFMRNRYDGEAGLQRLKDSTAEEIQLTGIASPPVHPSCRCRIVAKITQDQ